MAKKNQKRPSEMLPVLHPDAAGVDIGAEEFFVAVPERSRFRACKKIFYLHAGFT